ncbi:hypothetical protein [Roseibium album]|uniref:Peptidase S8 n=1 Tax=Roseibium album TaxID=311410 RepID=A0A0M6ZJ58_9HYPH|nr:hypothetical protein [Roseibium album]CTQ62798.1 hypothetical protein LA5094_05590 [Roseibium album]CTQ68726.1 hypothetical protein LA5096_01885 [Roseibium album]CTQ80382.1 hypothetical protein LA5095_05616 [Roseibium album]
MEKHIPRNRCLRVYSFDPSLASDIATWGINEITISVPWEIDEDGESRLQPGPIGEYIEVIDFDPASELFYKPVDLNDRNLLGQNGLPASETNPQFHQQMVYAVAMATIDHFEKAFGRKVFWANNIIREPKYREQFVERLRIYSHALRAQNAFYSPSKKALLFGYFPVTSKDEKNTPGTTVFTCLSHDIIVHEMSHALLDGIHPRFNEASNPDVHAFHEAFADVVAIFQRFSYEGVLESQISRTRGDLAGENLLAQLAQQFGRATGRGTALHDALGGLDPKTGHWIPRLPDPKALEGIYEPHARGAILVAAVFRAFTLVYHHRVADLFRLSTGGTGILPDGAIHPDLVGCLAGEAREIAARILRMCIRGLDYCPPVDLTFGDYLRAVVTADWEFNREDPDDCRVAFVQSFREWGIAPAGIRSMSVDALIWDEYATAGAKHDLREMQGTGDGETKKRTPDAQMLSSRRREYRENYSKHKRLLHQGYYETGEEDAPSERSGRKSQPRRRRKIQSIKGWGDRKAIWASAQDSTYPIWAWLNDPENEEVASVLNLELDPNIAPPTVYRNSRGNPTVEVHAVRPILRRPYELTGEVSLVVEVLQRRRGFFDNDEQQVMDKPGQIHDRTYRGDFTYRAGCTFFLNPETLDIYSVIRTPGTISNDVELARMRAWLTGEEIPLHHAFDRGPLSLSEEADPYRNEPFALLHEHDEE